MRDFDFSKAKVMYVNYLKWREDYGVDAIPKVISTAFSSTVARMNSISSFFSPLGTICLERCRSLSLRSKQRWRNVTPTGFMESISGAGQCISSGSEWWIWTLCYKLPPLNGSWSTMYRSKRRHWTWGTLLARSQRRGTSPPQQAF